MHTLTEQIRCKMARGTIEQEINDHIEDQKAEFLSEGMSQTEAEEAAVREMGDPVEVRLEMEESVRQGMIALIIGLSLAGYLLRSVICGRRKNRSVGNVISWPTMELWDLIFDDWYLLIFD